MSLDNYQVKWLAAVLMLIDHVGAVFFPDVEVLRILGRFSLPLFILLLVDGEKYTRNIKQYWLRLLILGLISQPIYQSLFSVSQWNILFTLSLGLVCLRLVSLLPRWQLLIWILGSTIAEVAGLEYGAYGIIAIALIRSFCSTMLWWMGWIAFHLATIIVFPSFITQLPAILAPLLLSLANHQPGQKARWFYVFYPFHLLVLWLINMLKPVFS